MEKRRIKEIKSSRDRIGLQGFSRYADLEKSFQGVKFIAYIGKPKKRAFTVVKSFSIRNAINHIAIVYISHSAHSSCPHSCRSFSFSRAKNHLICPSILSSSQVPAIS